MINKQTEIESQPPTIVGNAFKTVETTL